MTGRKSDTEETSKQKKLNRGNRLESDPTLPTTPEKFPELGREEKGEEETEATWWRKRRVQRRREWSSQ